MKVVVDAQTERILGVETGAIGSLTPPLRGLGSFGSMPIARVPGNGCRSSTMPGCTRAVNPSGSRLTMRFMYLEKSRITATLQH